MTDRLIDPAWQQTEQPDWHGYGDELEDEAGCAISGNPLDDGEGWDGLCGNCADRAESPDDHDRRFSEVYDGRTDIGDAEFPF